MGLKILIFHALEYQREGWSYHAKGLYIQPYGYISSDGNKNSEIDNSNNNNNNNNTNTNKKQHDLPKARIFLFEDKPTYGMVGSSNFGYRSLHLDSELQLSMLIPSQIQREELDKINNNNNNTL